MAIEDEYAPAYWAFAERKDVVELNQQLYNGLIHPLEYCTKVQALSGACGLWVVL